MRNAEHGGTSTILIEHLSTKSLDVLGIQTCVYQIIGCTWNTNMCLPNNWMYLEYKEPLIVHCKLFHGTLSTGTSHVCCGYLSMVVYFYCTMIGSHVWI